jgi:ketosteroid isomerase-like protein
MDPLALVSKFNDCINKQDIEGLAEFMTEDHIFIDALANTVKGKDHCIEAWNGFFIAFPDYRNVFKEITVENNLVKMLGYSTCSVPALHGPAIWTAKIRRGQIYEWRVYKDNSATREFLNIEPYL